MFCFGSVDGGGPKEDCPHDLDHMQVCQVQCVEQRVWLNIRKAICERRKMQ